MKQRNRAGGKYRDTKPIVIKFRKIIRSVNGLSLLNTETIVGRQITISFKEKMLADSVERRIFKEKDGVDLQQQSRGKKM